MQFFETIRIQDGRIYHIDYHNRRANTTRRDIFGIDVPLDLSHFITPPPHGLYRAKVIYDTEIREVAYYPYTPKKVQSLQLIHAHVDYPYKALDRSKLDSLYAKRDGCDEILIVKDGLVTDTSIHNVAFLYKGEWLTPKEPLLPGTTRQRLLERGRLKTKQIEAKDIKKFATMALMNAMVDFMILDTFTIKG